MSEIADYKCPECNGRLVRDNTAANRFRCRSCSSEVHEAIVENADALRRLADRDDKVGELAGALLTANL